MDLLPNNGHYRNLSVHCGSEGSVPESSAGTHVRQSEVHRTVQRVRSSSLPLLPEAPLRTAHIQSGSNRPQVENRGPQHETVQRTTPLPGNGQIVSAFHSHLRNVDGIEADSRNGCREFLTRSDRNTLAKSPEPTAGHNFRKQNAGLNQPVRTPAAARVVLNSPKYMREPNHLHLCHSP